MERKGFQILEDIATAAWYSEILFTAVEKELFDFTAKERSLGETAAFLGFPEEAAYRYLLSLETLSLLVAKDGRFRNTETAGQYLKKESPLYQGHSILWRKGLCRRWTGLTETLTQGRRTDFPVDESREEIEKRFRAYSFAMDDIARCKSLEILENYPVETEYRRILDLGSGLGAISRGFLEQWPDAEATFADMSEVMDLCAEILPPSLLCRIHRKAFNILEPWELLKDETFDLIIMSNVVHAFDMEDNLTLMGYAAEHLSSRGVILIHDFIREHCPPKAAALDLNMLLNTYNGHVFSEKEIHGILSEKGLVHTDLLPLPSDTALIVAAANSGNLTPWKKKGTL